MKGKNNTANIKHIKVDINKCIGCRACELACSAFHAQPGYSKINPAESRIRVMVDELNDTYVPVRSGHYVPSECAGRYAYIIDGKEYRECSFCRAACPSREYFKSFDSGLPRQCDMCESDPPLAEPWCVKVCGCGALTYIEQEAGSEDRGETQDEISTGLEALADKYGMDRVINQITRMTMAR